jgi:hypothetical protein
MCCLWEQYTETIGCSVIHGLACRTERASVQSTKIILHCFKLYFNLIWTRDLSSTKRECWAATLLLQNSAETTERFPVELDMVDLT